MKHSKKMGILCKGQIIYFVMIWLLNRCVYISGGNYYIIFDVVETNAFDVYNHKVPSNPIKSLQNIIICPL